MADNKSEKPTPQKLKQIREEGQFLSSRGLLTGVQFVVFVALSGSLFPDLLAHLKKNMAMLLKSAFESDLSTEAWPPLLRGIFLDALSPLFRFGAILFCTGLITHLSITKLGFSLKRFTPKLQAFSPLTKLKAMPAQNAKSVAEALLLMAVLTIFLSSFYRNESALFLQIPFQSVQATAAQVALAIHSMLWKAAAIFALFGAVDLAFQYRRYMNSIKMSKQDIRDENKRTEGDPQTKMRIRRLRRELLRRRMMSQVPLATAVVVNPTHYAVAIRYEMETMPSPIIVAKGKNWLALRIRQVATQNEVPIIENPPLARALYDAAEVGSVISPEFYKAIAEVLAYVYRLMGRKLPQ
jgi:flagellar biosynthetic protein FlhB